MDTIFWLVISILAAAVVVVLIGFVVVTVQVLRDPQKTLEIAQQIDDDWKMQ